jgi:sec-independent protein translocase protein TatC
VASLGKKSRNREGRMSLGAHLVELRKRLYVIALAIAVATVAGWFLGSPLLEAMKRPIEEIARSQHRIATLNYDSVASAFDLRIQIAFTIGLVIASPIWLYQIFAYFMPALTRKELKYVFGFFFSAIPLFIGGVLVGWYVYPRVVEVMTSIAPPDSSSIITAKTYFDFVLKFVLVIGVAFVLPVFLIALNFAGVISGKGILKAWRWAILIIIVFTAMATPAADVLSMILLAGPMVVLYFGAAAIGLLHDKRAAKKQAAVIDGYIDTSSLSDLSN